MELIRNVWNGILLSGFINLNYRVENSHETNLRTKRQDLSSETG